MTVKLNMAAIVSKKGQVVIPKAVREALGIQPGSQVEFEVVAQVESDSHVE
ncbi:MAG: AbrB/MazE/SpoVT family DNA-binding domain-containing protein [Burkholderiales bacterium]